MDFKKLTKPQMDIAEMVIEAATTHGVDPNLLLAQAFRESRFSHIPSEDPKSDAFGVMQIRPSTAEENKLGDTRDLKTNINGGAKLMRQYLDKYKSPEAALLAYHQGPGVADTYIKSGGDLKSVGPKGLDYVINIGENGGFGTPAAPTENKAPSVTDPFSGYKPKARTDSGDALPALVPEQSKTEKVMGAVADTGEYLATKALENPEIPAAAGVGLIKGTLEKVLQSPEKHLVDLKKGETTPEEVKAARTNAKTAQTRIGEIQQLASERVPIDVDSLQREFDLRKFSNEIMDDDLRAAKNELKALPKTYVPPVEPPAPSSLISQIDLTRTGPASGPKIEGDSSARNWTIKTAGQKHQMPEAVLDAVTDQTGTSKTGGMTLIREDLRNLERIKELGMGDSKLATTSGGAQLQLPSAESARLEQELAARQAQEVAEQSVRAQQIESQRLAAEADLARQRQMAELRVEQARKSKISSGERATDARKAANTARQQVAAQAKSDATRLDTATINARTAQKSAQEVAEAQPSALKMATREAGRRFAEKAPIIGNVLGAAGATLSTDEAIDRYKKGDYSGAVLGTIEAALNTASMAPPTSPLGLAAKGVGTVGSLGMIPVWIAHDYFGNKGPWAPKNPPQKARGGLTLMR